MELFRPCDVKYCEVIYLIQISSLDVASNFKVVNFISKSSNSIDLCIVYDGVVAEYAVIDFFFSKKKILYLVSIHPL